ncbi:ABC transporter ATP-binding protein [Microcella sp.]|uniref:ABC transporter ATP-binding protein n=1 Tax=Microcella sp. TaxID=1913979 RepID=UPI00391879F2
MSASLVVDEVTVEYDDPEHPAIAEVSLAVAAGECLALLGPSGSGKSTVLRTIAGLEIPTRGRIIVDGADVGHIEPEHRGMAMVFQRPLLFPHLSVLDNVAFAGIVAGVPKRRARAHAETYLELVQLEGFGQRPVSALSGGQEQRVALARALAADPRVLLLDEPFSALDPELRADMHELLARIRAELSPTIVMVTHDRDEAAAVADSVALLRQGRVLQSGPITALYRRPVSLEVAKLMGGRNAIPGVVRGGVHHSPLGAIASPLGEEWPSGGGMLVVRHELIRLGSPMPDDHAVVASVTAVAERGPRTRVTLTLPDAVLECEVATGAAPQPGEQVTACIPRSGCTVIADSAR